ncbi:hypothetical protein ATANTOWER_026297 [Ataeniobius toweri]|uniref:Uncharacterized protein n=1 Tax=Ataeniobius toweri TaxID=208326 RepID=A0ABU7C9J1_9TELE|nr:hypothetical protein [Ataeniobius toweri]
MREDHLRFPEMVVPRNWKWSTAETVLLRMVIPTSCLYADSSLSWISAIGSLHDVATQLPVIGSCEGEYFLFGCSPPKAMALYYTRCLQDLPKVSVSDVLHLI